MTDNLKPEHKKLVEKILNQKRIEAEEAILLYEMELGTLAWLANTIRERKNGHNAFYIKNFHIEPTNICIYNCRFCSYSSKATGNAWEHGLEKIRSIIQTSPKDAREVHITGGVHPSRDVAYYSGILKAIKEERPDLHIKAYSAVELYKMIENAGMQLKDGLQMLKTAGLDSIPGGGAEIFAEDVRKKICPDKATGNQWLEVHRQAHLCGIRSGATMLYGHIESYADRIDHMNQLRKLQDETKGFLSFIPLKFRNSNNPMSDIAECSAIEDLKDYAVSRIFLDNFDHIKAYWPMIGKQMTQILLEFGVDDIDGTIDDTTEIYSRAGAEDQNPGMSSNEMRQLIETAGFTACERDSVYNIIN